MSALKKYFGLLFMLIAPFVIYELVHGALSHIDPAGKKDITLGELGHRGAFVVKQLLGHCPTMVPAANQVARRYTHVVEEDLTKG